MLLLNSRIGNSGGTPAADSVAGIFSPGWHQPNRIIANNHGRMQSSYITLGTGIRHGIATIRAAVRSRAVYSVQRANSRGRESMNSGIHLHTAESVSSRALVGNGWNTAGSAGWSKDSASGGTHRSAACSRTGRAAGRAALPQATCRAARLKGKTALKQNPDDKSTPRRA